MSGLLTLCTAAMQRTSDVRRKNLLHDTNKRDKHYSNLRFEFSPTIPINYTNNNSGNISPVRNLCQRFYLFTTTPSFKLLATHLWRSKKKLPGVKSYTRQINERKQLFNSRCTICANSFTTRSDEKIKR